MTDANPFDELIREVRSGDSEAAAELVRRYEPFIRRAARNRLRSPHLRRVLDSMDICQSVLASLFARTAQGQYELDTPDQLQKLLFRMVHNKVVDLWRRYEVRILGAGGMDLNQIADKGAPANREDELEDLVEQVRQRLSPDERALLTARLEGKEWSQITGAGTESAEALRKRLSRALRQAAADLGLRSQES